MKAIGVSKLTPNSYFETPVYLDKTYIILSPETPVTQELIRRLNEWRYTHVYSESEQFSTPGEGLEGVVEPAKGVLDMHITASNKEQEVNTFYEGFQEYVERMYQRFAESSFLDMSSLTDKVKEVIERLKTDKDMLVSHCAVDTSSRSYLVKHSVNSAILSLLIGDFLKFTPHRLIDLGIAAVLHEIGMLKLPPALYENNMPLTPKQKQAITAHTIFGYRLLKAKSVHDNIASCAMEHHERADGSGYPKGLAGENISLYARIVGVACSFCAIVSSHGYKDARDGHKAMIELLTRCKAQYDENVLKALVYSISIFPPGTFVVLSNNMKGVVFQTNPAKPRLPVVKLLANEAGQKLEKPSLVQTSEDKGLTILRVMEEGEINSLGLWDAR